MDVNRREFLNELESEIKGLMGNPDTLVGKAFNDGLMCAYYRTSSLLTEIDTKQIEAETAKIRAHIEGMLQEVRA